MAYLPIISSLIVFLAVLLGADSVGAVWDKIARRYVADLTPMLEALSIDQSKVPDYLRWWGFAMIGGFVVVTFILSMPPVAVAVVYLTYVAPRLILRFLIARRQVLLRDQMVGASVALANATRAGLSLAQGLDSVSRETPKPLANDLQRIVSDFNHGRPLGEAIADTQRRLRLDSFTLFASAVLVNLERGGRITEALERISESLQENQRVERKIDAETAGGRSVVWILTAFPFLFLLLFFFLHPEGTMMVFQSLIGQFVLLAIIVLVYGSFRWSQKILDIEV